MPFEHLAQALLDEIRAAILELVGYDPLTRGALLAGIPAQFRGLLPGALAPPATGIILDTDMLNKTERLVDGTVPLKRFLENAVGLAGTIEKADVLRRTLADVESGTTGASPIAAAGLPEIHEEIVFRDDMVPFGFMEGGVAAAAAVAKLIVPRYEAGAPKTANGKPIIYLGTGWLVGSGLLMTNHHVVNARKQGEAAASDSDLRLQAANMSILFDYDGEGVPGTSVAAKEAIAWDPALDFALVRINDLGRPALQIAARPVENVGPESAVAVNVIQHPDGRPKLFAIRNNLVTAATPTEIRYFTDTLGGSSGSPVLNDAWEVVALHRGAAFVRGVKFQGRDVAYVNVGTQIAAIIEYLRASNLGKIPELGI